MKMESDKQTHMHAYGLMHQQMLYLTVCKICIFIFEFSTMLFANIIAQQNMYERARELLSVCGLRAHIHLRNSNKLIKVRISNEK